MSIGVGVIGAGVVGGGVVRTLLTNRDVIKGKAGVDVSLVHVADARPDLFKDFDLSGITTSTDAKALIADPKVHVVC